MAHIIKTPTYFFVDEDGTENVANYKPYRHEDKHFWIVGDLHSNFITELPKGTIKALFNLQLTWKDEPIVINPPII